MVSLPLAGGRRVRRALTSTLFTAALLAVRAHAQDKPPQPPPAPAPDPDEEARKLREAADDETSPGGPSSGGPVDETEKLRRQADAATQDDPLRDQLLAAFYSVGNRLNALNPRITAFGDIVGRAAMRSHGLVVDGHEVDDRVSLVEGELDLRADIDPYSKAVLILAFEEESPGSYGVDIEEGYMTLETLPFGFHAQLGRFRVPFGRINAVHRHDLPQTTRPYPVSDMFGADGLQENGGILTWLAPKIPLTLTAAVMNGENEQLLAGQDSASPSYLGRGELFMQLTDRSFLSFGSSFLFGYSDAPLPIDSPGDSKSEVQLWGADVLYKWNWNDIGSVVFQAECFGLKKEVAGGGRDNAFGAYGLVQVQPFQRWYFGVRYDWSNYDDAREGHEQYALGAWISFYTTEFLRFRVGYEHRERESTNGGDPDLDTLFFQCTFVFGSHPAEPYWVNR